MIATIIIVTLAFGYLLFETHGLTIRLQTGKDKQYTDNWTPYYKELLAQVSMSPREIFEQEHAEQNVHSLKYDYRKDQTTH